MKRRLQSVAESDSLELLLDTLCNVFGGIVLIACLLAILPRQEMSSPLMPSDVASSEMLERRLIAAREEVIRLKSEITRLEEFTDPNLAELQNRRDSLKRIHGRLRKDLTDQQDIEANEAELRAIARQGDPAALAEALKELKLQKSKSEGLESATSGKNRFLAQRIVNLQEEAEGLKKGKTQAVRFPRERISEASPLPIILRYNAVYPMGIGAGLDINPSINRISISENDGFRAEPVKDRGIETPSTDKTLAATLNAANARRLYATIYLYPDSHHAFGKLKEALSKAAIPYGIEFVKSDKVLYFSSEGTCPPQL
jgi:hypothetical protein